MSDYMQTPNIVTDLKLGDFTLHCFAYRKLTKAELNLCARKWLSINKRKSFPKTGSGKIITTLGCSLE